MIPKELGYRFPAEWEKHEATWLTWPYLDDSFPGKLDKIYSPYLQFIKQIALAEKVRINVPDESYITTIKNLLAEYSIKDNNVELFLNPSNDVWCRDHGPAFIVHPDNPKKKAVVNWEFNAWGNKYPFDLDNQIPVKIAAHFNFDIYQPGIIMEGGSIDVNGIGDLLTTKSCLLNKNRNPHLTQQQIEQYLCNFYCADHVLWLSEGIAGDDTDGHIDDVARFVNNDTVVTMIETNKNDINFKPLKDNLERLKKMRLSNGKQINIIEIPMPMEIYYNSQRMPASYANFYFSNSAVIVPTFQCKNDDTALKILSEVIKDRPVIGIDSIDIIKGYGSFHCLSQQEPCVPVN